MLQVACQKLRTRNVTRLVSKIKDPECLRTYNWNVLYGKWNVYLKISTYFVYLVGTLSGTIYPLTLSEAIFNHNLFSKFRVLKYTYEYFARTHARILKYWVKIATLNEDSYISRSQNCLLIWIMTLFCCSQLNLWTETLHHFTYCLRILSIHKNSSSKP